MIYHALIRETFHFKQTNITYFLFPQTLLVNPNFVAATCESSSRCAQGRGKAVFFLVSKARLWCQLAGNPRFSKIVSFSRPVAMLSPCHCQQELTSQSAVGTSFGISGFEDLWSLCCIPHLACSNIHGVCPCPMRHQDFVFTVLRGGQQDTLKLQSLWGTHPQKCLSR